MLKRLFAVILIMAGISPAWGQQTQTQKNIAVSTDIFAVALPATAIVYELATKDWQGVKQGAFTAVTAIGAVYLLKYTVHKERPDGSDFHSFPSMHTAASFASAAFIQRRFGWQWGFPAYALACYVGWGRTFAKKHDWWDVLAGAAIGAGAAYIYTRPFANNHQLTIVPCTFSQPFSDTPSFGLYTSFTF